MHCVAIALEKKKYYPPAKYYLLMMAVQQTKQHFFFARIPPSQKDHSDWLILKQSVMEETFKSL
jgi:hypothetical protein